MSNGKHHNVPIQVEMLPQGIRLITPHGPLTLDHGSSVQLALACTHWLLEQVVHKFRILPRVILPPGKGG